MRRIFQPEASLPCTVIWGQEKLPLSVVWRARGLGIDARVYSPTFTIVNEYPGSPELIHFDMYRLHSADELFDIGWEDYLNRGAICAVEWSENVSDAFFGDEICVTIEKIGDTSRKITIGERT